MPFLLPGRAKVCGNNATNALPCQLEGKAAMQAQKIYGENMKPVVLLEDEPLHTLDHPFCLDPGCLCKLDEWLLWEVSRWIENGLMTQQEGELFVAGRTV